jgi:outer membrane lipoprotein-sorting protein
MKLRLTTPLQSVEAATGSRVNCVRKICGRAVLLVLLLIQPKAAVADDLDLDQILSRMMEMDRSTTAALKGYTCTRRYFLENKRLGKRAEMQVRASHRHPGKKSFEVLSESGSATIRKRVFRRLLESELEASSDELRDDTQITPANYDFRLLAAENVDGRKSYVLEASPKKQNRFLMKGRIWLDAEDFAIVRIEGSPAKNPSVWIRKTTFVHRYGKFGRFWLPVSNESETEALIFGRTQVRIEYFEHQIQASPEEQPLAR